MYQEYFPTKRYEKTLEFVNKHITKDEQILDLGVENPFSNIMRKEGFQCKNTGGEDLDLEYDLSKYGQYDVLTGFEILEHLVSPLNVLKSADCNKVMLTVPLKYWFASAYKSKTDQWDRHYHEFEDWQFDWLIEKAGWTIKDRVKWKNPGRSIGIRPLLRNFYPRYYGIYAER